MDFQEMECGAWTKTIGIRIGTGGGRL